MMHSQEVEVIVTDEFAGWYAELSDPSRNAVLILGGAKVGDDRFYRWFIPQAESIWNNI